MIWLSNSIAYNQTVHTPLPCLNKTFSVIVHMVRDSSGGTYITENEVIELIDSVSIYFDSICVDFEICEFRYVNNYQYDSVEISSGEFEQMQTDYNETYRINMYFVTYTTSLSSYATQNGISMIDSGGILVLKGASPSQLTHEMGHYFNLLHTFHGSQSGNPELVDGSNCATSGDLICDTPADPYFSGYPAPWFSIYTGAYDYPGLDANGQYYIPNVQNIMSNYPDKCYFTNGQYRRMVMTYLSSSPKMW